MKQVVSHGLVVGTTGSVKVNYSNHNYFSGYKLSSTDVVFVLIDYKGGGMADVFKHAHLLEQ